MLISRGVFDITTDFYKVSGGTRVMLFLKSFYNNDGSINLFGRPGIFTNIGRSYNSNIGEFSDSLYTSLVGNLGIIIIPIILVIILIVLSNYLILLKYNFKILRDNYSYKTLIILPILVASIGINTFEIYPIFPILACTIFARTNYDESFTTNN
tara:strand:- start:6218 stop:6679 length:462 start_codon:yes stop_codon:yes gene_type:complete